jgi:threonyl-tRNA synthetase
MKILAIHADYVEFQAKKKAFKNAEEIDDQEKHHIKECLVIYTAVEQRDEENKEIIVKKYVDEIVKIADQLKAENIVLYPYAHLSASLSNPTFAQDVMKEAEKVLSENYTVARAPFGWYKSFNIACKGHPLSELSREFGPEESKVKVVKSAEKFELNDKKLIVEEKIKFSTAYLFVAALEELYKGIDFGSAGFYNDKVYVDVKGIKLNQTDFKKIEKKMKELIEQGLTFEKTADKSKLNKYQLEIDQDLGNVQAYQLGKISLVPLFNEPFIDNVKDIGAFKITNMGSAYWKNSADNEQLERIYLVGFKDEEWLKQYEQKMLEAEERDHNKIGKDLDLFVTSKIIGQGLPLLTPKGAKIKQILQRFIEDEEEKRGYQSTMTPLFAKSDLYKISGHWDHYKEGMFVFKVGDQDFALRPMTCPFQFIIYNSKQHSYKDLPMRLSETSTLFRNETSGEMHGLIRVRQFTISEAHLICTPKQVEDEFKDVLKLIQYVMKVLGIDKDISYRFSKWDPNLKGKYINNPKAWENSQNQMRTILDNLKLDYEEADGEAAFYGPKLDVQFKNVHGKEDTIITIQIDFALPERFDMTYIDEKGEKQRPIIIHRTSIGCYERTLAMLIEKYAGKFPLWLNPEQVRIVTVTDRNNKFAEEVKKQLTGFRVTLDNRQETIGKKVREAQVDKVNYIVTIGDKETEEKNLAIRSRNGEVKFAVKVEDFLKQLEKEVAEKVIN